MKPKLRTILVVYSERSLTPKETQTLKRYTFNTRSPVKPGDRFDSSDYTTPMQVVEIMPRTYRFVDTFSGELSNKRKPSTKQFEIREVEIGGNEKPDSLVRARRLDLIKHAFDRFRY